MSLSSTLFLMGPMRQCKAMFDPTRLFATIIVIASIAATLFCAFYVRIGRNQRFSLAPSNPLFPVFL